MSTVFRLYQGGANTYEDWNDSPSFPYNYTNLQSIKDPNGAKASSEITSIPSPFARIDLIKTAFKNVSEPDPETGKVELDGSSIFHKMVSDTLDVGEIFFNAEKFKDKIEIITWDVSMLQQLANQTPGQEYLRDAIEKYLLTDAASYNFDQMKNIYLLNYKNGPAQLNIIGATSPATIFFSNANDLSFVNDINFGKDKPFDSEYQPLYKRDFAYIKMWFVLKAVIPNFASTFPEIQNYLNETFKALTNQNQKSEINAISVNTTSEYSLIDVKTINTSNQVEVLGHYLYQKLQKQVTESDFLIRSSVSTKKVLVLPTESGGTYSQLQYTTDSWGTTNKAPYYDAQNDLSKRLLPNDGSISPYLTISDFLEDSLVMVPHTLNTAHFFDGNIQIKESKKSFLLPLKPLFFEYFTSDELQAPLSDGKSMIEMESLAGDAVRVYLRIPIKGSGRISSIEYSRIYYSGGTTDIENNKGGIVSLDFTSFVMPNVKFSNPDEALYKIGCVSTKDSKIRMDFLSAGITLNNITPVCRHNNSSETYKSDTYTVDKSNFECIQITDPKTSVKAMIVPIFSNYNCVNTFEFAIDLGTSNTHIEYKKQGAAQISSFNYDISDELLCPVFVPSYFVINGVKTNDQDDLIQENALIEKDYLPSKVGDEYDFKFPTRTVLSHSKSFSWQSNCIAFGDANIPLTYDKRHDLIYNTIEDNIKWGNGTQQYYMDAFVDCLMLMIRNKVIKNDGDLSKTKITWFYPLSMAKKRLNRLQATWDASYQKYFNKNGNTLSLSESAAPIQYYFNSYNAATNMVNVDIGGGTTDIAFSDNKVINAVTSFRFAANSLFEDAFASANLKNGIVDHFKDQILDTLKQNASGKINDLIAVSNSENNQKPSNMASFLFSLKNNSYVKDFNPNTIDLNRILQDDENFKIVFILFYSAIIYHIAQIIKVRDLALPRHIAFSGNGSRLISIVSPNTRILEDYTKLMLETITGKKASPSIGILGLEKNGNPKEATCKGGLLASSSDNGAVEIIVLNSNGSAMVGTDDTYAHVNDSYKSDCIKNVSNFFNFVLNDMNKAFKFDDNFGVTPMSLDIAKNLSGMDLNTYLNKGIDQASQEAGTEEPIGETFFFYPIKGVLNELSTKINESLKNQ